MRVTRVLERESGAPLALRREVRAEPEASPPMPARQMRAALRTRERPRFKAEAAQIPSEKREHSRHWDGPGPPNRPLRSLPVGGALALSGGERRRVEIARCLAANPRYLLLDEPFAGVDPISVGDIRHLVSDLKTRGIGVLITDHNVRETLEIVDRAYILHDGMVLMSGTPEEVVHNENVRRVYLGEGFRIS